MQPDNNRLFNYLELCIWALTATAFVGGGLIDLDLGWHLVGGLYIIENMQIPNIDPLNIDGHFWWNYSWLAQVVLATVYKATGFVGLQVLQNIVVITLVVTLFYCFNRVAMLNCFRSHSEIRILRLIAFIITLFLVFPVAYLRPQLFSIIFFCLLLFWLERNAVKLISTMALAILWANIHVYWILAPVVLGLYAIQKLIIEHDRKEGIRLLWLAVFLLFCAFISPYGYHNFSGVFAYLFQHTAAYGLINEFQPLGFRQGISFWFYLIAIIGFCVFSSKSAFKRYFALSVLFIAFALLSLYRMKYLPIFGVVSGYVYILVLSDRLMLCKQKYFVSSYNKVSSRLMVIIAAILVGSYVIICLALISRQTILKEEYQELLQITQDISKDSRFSDSENVRVLTHFDNGGWVGLGFWLNKALLAKESKFKTFIDGRTLVAGEKNLRDFDCLRQGCENWCQILENRKFDMAILPRNSSIAKLVSKESSCPVKFSKAGESKQWVFYY